MDAASTLTLLLPSVDRSQDVARILKELGFRATAPPDPLDGFGHVVRIEDVFEAEVSDLLCAVRRHAADAQWIRP